MMRSALIAALLLAGCAPNVIPTEPPASWMMSTPKSLEDVPQGADYKTLYADLRHDAAKEKRQLRGLQKYARTLTGK